MEYHGIWPEMGWNGILSFCGHLYKQMRMTAIFTDDESLRKRNSGFLLQGLLRKFNFKHKIMA